MSLILHYPLNQTDPTVALVGATATQGTEGNAVTSSVDATYGTVAYFDDTEAYLSTPTPNELASDNPRTISLWAKRDRVTNQYVYSNGSVDISNNERFELFLWVDTAKMSAKYANAGDELSSTVSGAFVAGRWFHVVTTYDGTYLRNYVDGVLVGSKSVTLNTSVAFDFTVGAVEHHYLNLEGSMVDFRIYDGALDPTAVSELFTSGPNDANVGINLTPYTHLIDIDWSEVSGATTYYVKYVVDSGDEQDLIITTELSHVFYNVVPGSSYEFRVYTDLDIITPVFTEITVTPVVNTANTDSLFVRLGNDLTLLSDDSVDDFRTILGSVLTTGEAVNTSVGPTTFVANSDTLTLPELTEHMVLTPFDQSAGTGQTVSVILPDTSTLSVVYDETLNEIDVGGTTYAVGETFVSGGLKVTVMDL